MSTRTGHAYAYCVRVLRTRTRTRTRTGKRAEEEEEEKQVACMLGSYTEREKRNLMDNFIRNPNQQHK